MKAKQNRPFLLTVLALVIFLLMADYSGCQAQVNSRYNLSDVRIGLINGQAIKGAITSFAADSLALKDNKIAPPGAAVELRYGTGLVHGTVVAVTEDELLVSTKDAQEHSRIPRKKITYLRILESPLSKDATLQFQQRWYRATSINFIALRKKGAGVIGAVVGTVAGATIGYLLFGNQTQAPTQPGQFKINVVEDGVAEGALLGLIGLGVGTAVGTSKNKILVQGRLDWFHEARASVVKSE